MNDSFISTLVSKTNYLFQKSPNWIHWQKMSQSAAKNKCYTQHKEIYSVYIQIFSSHSLVIYIDDTK